MRFELRIARAEAPKDEKAEAKWQKELEVFYDHLGIVPLDGATPSDGQGWWVQPTHPKDEGKAAVRLLELREGEIRPRVGLCYRCLKEKGGTYREVAWNHVGTAGQRCSDHGGRDYNPEEE